ncbi:hypothetical protein C2E21_3421 [Chlorella sorokiniana]|uniref:Uncharacterized protein n=1 Tax=Chlorella sorokiniana TaxID=3076 RepID=A0A2P6TUY7_CHLSO|nr:hypothetical protein C2E21_3421 [Chlorella sorokiniana]|eukprot:PRW57883.1 hypothetical protein C2E21_3421 [Chlorella sorokiniana]
MAGAVAPSLQHRLLAAQVGGHGSLQSALEAALDACAIPAGGATADLRRLLLGHANTAAVLAVAANASGHPCAPSILLARLLSSSLVSAGELLGAADPAELALAVTVLHAAVAGALPAPAAAAAKEAFVTLIKVLATSSSATEQQQRAAECMMAHLRRAWLASDAMARRAMGGDGVLLLAAAVDAVDAEVFPRHLAHRWVATELGHVLRSPDAEQHEYAGPGSSWAAATAAFAAALPVEALLEQAQAAAWEGRLHPQRAAALLAAAAQQHPPAGRQVEQWAAAQASAALAQHAAAPLHALLLLQRELLLWRDGAAGSTAASAAQQQQQQQRQQQSAQQAYKLWFAATLVAPDQLPHLQFWVQQVLIPLVPEESGGCGWLQAQADVLAGLLRLAQQPGAAPVPQAAARAAEEYLEAAKQRLKAEQTAAAAAGGGQAAPGGPAAPLTNLQKGQTLVAAMLREYEDCGGELRSGTLNQMQAKASNVFARGEIHNMLLPALLAPTDDDVEVQRRVAFMQYLYQELGRRGDTQIRPQLKPEALALFHQRCLQAQLEGATLQQLVARAPQLLTTEGSDASGSISSHQVLDKLGRLRVMLALPLSGADAMARSAAVAAAHLSCLRHFRQHCLLPDTGANGSSGSSGAAALALRWQRAAADPAGSYDGEFVARLVFPACTAAVRLLQWLLLRLSVGSQLLPSNQPQGGGGAGWDKAGRAAKRQRSATGFAADVSADSEAVLGACSRALQSATVASLAAAAGGLPLADYLRLEALATSSSGGTSDLLPPGAAEAALRLCCTLYLQTGGSGGSSGSGSSSSELGVLIQPLVAAPAGVSGSAGGAYVEEGDVLTIPDSEEEDEPPAAGGTSSTASSSSLAEALGAAAAAAVADAAQQQAGAAAAAALSAAKVQQAVAALASGLALELLPLPLSGSGTFEAQQRRLAAVAEAVQWALSDAGLGTPPAQVQQQLAAALEGA